MGFVFFIFKFTIILGKTALKALIDSNKVKVAYMYKVVHCFVLHLTKIKTHNGEKAQRFASRSSLLKEEEEFSNNIFFISRRMGSEQLVDRRTVSSNDRYFGIGDYGTTSTDFRWNLRVRFGRAVFTTSLVHDTEYSGENDTNYGGTYYIDVNFVIINKFHCFFFMGKRNKTVREFE